MSVSVLARHHPCIYLTPYDMKRRPEYRGVQALSGTYSVDHRMGLGSEKCVMPSSVGNARRLLKKINGFEGWKWSILMLFWGQSTPIPIPPPLKILFRFTLISKMVLGVGKKCEIRLKSRFCPYVV